MQAAGSRKPGARLDGRLVSGKGIIINHCGTSSHFNFAETQNKEAVALESALSRWIGLGCLLCSGRVARQLDQQLSRATEQKLIQIPLTTTSATGLPFRWKVAE